MNPNKYGFKYTKPLDEYRLKIDKHLTLILDKYYNQDLELENHFYLFMKKDTEFADEYIKQILQWN